MRKRRERELPERRPSRVTAAERPADDVLVILANIQERYGVLRRRGQIPDVVDGEIRNHLSAVAACLHQPLPGADRPPDVPPIMESLARLLSLMDGLAERGAPSSTAAPATDGMGPAPVPAAPSQDVLPVPVSPSLMATVEGIYGTRRWHPDGDGAPQFDYVSRNGSGQISLTFARQPGAADGVAALWEAVKSLKTETVDILLLLVSRLAELPNPRKDTAYMRLEEIAEARGVSMRDGSPTKLHDDFREQIIRLAALRLSIRWQDVQDDDTIDFFRDMPAHLLTIVDYTRRRQGTTWHAVEFSCGPALACFMRQDDLRLVGQYSRALLRLSANHDGVTKRVGTFYSFVGTSAAKAGAPITVTARALLKFIGLEPETEHPGRTVDAIVQAHHRLHEIGILARPSDWEPPVRTKGFFDDWLDEPRRVYLSALFAQWLSPSDASPPALLPTKSEATCPPGPDDLRARPELIRAFCKKYGILLQELAASVGVTPPSITRYVQGKRPVPPSVAAQIHTLWRAREHGRG